MMPTPHSNDVCPAGAPGTSNGAAPLSGASGQAVPAFSVALPVERSDYPRDMEIIWRHTAEKATGFPLYRRLCLGVFALAAIIFLLLLDDLNLSNLFDQILLVILGALLLFFALFTFVKPFCLWVLGKTVFLRAKKAVQKQTNPPKYASRFDFYPDHLEIFHGDRPEECDAFSLRAVFEGRMRYCVMDDYLVMKGPCSTTAAEDQPVQQDPDNFGGYMNLRNVPGPERERLLAYLENSPEWKYSEK